MAEDDDPISGTPDAINPWTLRSIPNEVRNTAIAAARAENMTVSQWIERIVRHYTTDGVSPQSHVPSHPASGRPDLIDLLREAREMAHEPEVPMSLKRSVFALARDVVRQVRGLPPPAPRRRLSGPDAESAAMLASDESE
jgi:hypothetical protein